MEDLDKIKSEFTEAGNKKIEGFLNRIDIQKANLDYLQKKWKEEDKDKAWDKAFKEFDEGELK